MGSKLRNLHELDAHRIMHGSVIDFWGGYVGDETCGAFFIPLSMKTRALQTTGAVKKFKVIVSGSEGWDHVSVSLPDRCPSWEEMDAIKRVFFTDDATCFQLHVPPSDHRSLHPFCLHIWRPHDVEIPRPPDIFVAPAQSAKQALEELSA